jgi:hypothetical protein
MPPGVEPRRGLRRLADRLPISWHGTVLDGELIADRLAGTMAALLGLQAPSGGPPLRRPLTADGA